MTLITKGKAIGCYTTTNIISCFTPGALILVITCMNVGSQVSIMTKLSEDDCSSKDEKKDSEGESDGTVTNDPNHPLLKVSHNMNECEN